MRVQTLAIHPGALGDVLLAVPALRTLRRRGALTLAAQPRIGALLADLGVVDAWRPFDSLRLDGLFVEEGEPSEVVRAAACVVCWFGARDPVFTRRLQAAAPGAIVAPPASTDGGLVWRHLLATVGSDVGVSIGGGAAPCEPIEVPERLRDDACHALDAARSDRSGPVLVIQPGAGGPAKRWPGEGFAAALAPVLAAGATPVVHSGPADAEAATALVSALGPPAIVLREPSLPVLAGVLALARAYVGNDSGVSHLAAAVGAPSVVLFAGANLAWRPWSPTARCLTVAMDRAQPAEIVAVRAALETAVG